MASRSCWPRRSAQRLLILLGDGVVAGVLLAKSKAQNAGWIVITAGWALGRRRRRLAVGGLSGAHLNPAVTVGLAATAAIGWDLVPCYLGGEFIGAFIGAVVVWLHYCRTGPKPRTRALSWPCSQHRPRDPQHDLEPDQRDHRHVRARVRVLAIARNAARGRGLAALLVGFLVWGIGLSLGGTTGYAINPARDLGPRIAHAVLPIPGKGDSDWGYSLDSGRRPDRRRRPGAVRTSALRLLMGTCGLDRPLGG